MFEMALGTGLCYSGAVKILPIDIRKENVTRIHPVSMIVIPASGQDNLHMVMREII